MKAVVYHGPGHKAWEKGDVPTVRQGRILGHEAVGTIEEVVDVLARFPSTDARSAARKG
jgi:D-arabinose 1-dehydrogenase-like Zn-dependent alcohol dehydrogenase